MLLPPLDRLLPPDRLLLPPARLLPLPETPEMLLPDNPVLLLPERPLPDVEPAGLPDERPLEEVLPDGLLELVGKVLSLVSGFMVFPLRRFQKFASGAGESLYCKERRSTPCRPKRER